jgi:hypothetical protein
VVRWLGHDFLEGIDMLKQVGRRGWMRWPACSPCPMEMMPQQQPTATRSGCLLTAKCQTSGPANKQGHKDACSTALQAGGSSLYGTHLVAAVKSDNPL